MCLLFYRIRFASRNVLLLSFKQGHLAYKVFSCLEEKINSLVRLLNRKGKPDSFVEKGLWSGGALGIWRNGSTFVANKSAINTITNVTTMRNRWAAQRR